MYAITLNDLLARFDEFDNQGVTYHFIVGHNKEEGTARLELQVEGDAPGISLVLANTPNNPDARCVLEIFEGPEPGNLTPYTVFCRQSNDRGTTWIGSVQAGSTERAKVLGLRECADAWDMDPDQIAVIGVAQGDIQILEWEDLTDC